MPNPDAQQEEAARLAQMMLDIHAYSEDPFYKDLCKVCSEMVRAYWMIKELTTRRNEK